MPNSRQASVIVSPSSSLATNRRRSSITEHSFHGIDTSPGLAGKVLPMCPVRSGYYVSVRSRKRASASFPGPIAWRREIRRASVVRAAVIDANAADQSGLGAYRERVGQRILELDRIVRHRPSLLVNQRQLVAQALAERDDLAGSSGLLRVIGGMDAYFVDADRLRDALPERRRVRPAERRERRLKQCRVRTAGAVEPVPEHQPRELFVVGHRRIRRQLHARYAHRSGDLDAGLDREVLA